MRKAKVIRLTFDDYLREQSKLIDKYGDAGFLLYTENRAFLCFDTMTEIRFYIIGKSIFESKDFKLDHTHIDVIGESEKEFESSKTMFVNDLKYNNGKIILFSVLFFLFFNPIWGNIEVLGHFNDIMITVMSIFLSMLFVFIGFFYGDRERVVDVYKKGSCDREFATDKYVLILSFVALILFIFSLLAGELKSDNLPDVILQLPYIREVINADTKFIFCGVISYSAMIVTIICFDSLINYYLKTIRNRYMIDAVNEMVESRKTR